MPDHSEQTRTSGKSQGDDEGKALEINDRPEPDEPDLESRSGRDYEGKALQINDNSRGSTDD